MPSTDKKEDDQKKKVDEDKDIIESSIGTLGRWQIWVLILICLVKFPVAWHQLSYTFLAPETEFVCVDNRTDKCSSECPGYVYDRSLFSETIITQWDLVCGKSSLADLSQTFTMLGILVGNMVFGYLSDRFGRRNPLIWAVIMQGLTGICVAIVPWFPVFVLLRFLLACATGGTMVTSFVLIMETIGIKWRTTLGILYQIPFNMGHLSLPLIAYFIRDWRYFQIVLSAPSLFLVIYYWLLPESPRYLLTVKKESEAIAVMTKAAKTNKLPTDNIEANVKKYLNKVEVIDADGAKNSGNIINLVKTPHMRMNTICICFNWFACGLCFFGVAHFVGRLGGDIFVNVALSAVIQLPSTLFTMWCIKAWGRKYSLLFGNILSGTAIMLIAVVPSDQPWLRTTFSTTGIFGLAVCFPVVYIYSGELFPTVVRNIGVGTSSMSARIGSMIAPHIVSLVTIEPWLPPLIFGIAPLIGAILTLKLPETLDCKLPDTIPELEAFCSNLKKKKITTIENGTETKL